MADDPTLWFGPAVGAIFGWLNDTALYLRSIGRQAPAESIGPSVGCRRGARGGT